MKLVTLIIALIVIVILQVVNTQKCNCSVGTFMIEQEICVDNPQEGESEYIENCSIYKYDYSLKIWLCLSCSGNNYLSLNQQKCIQGSVQNCSQYNGTSGQCTQCVKEYYLHENMCKKRDVNIDRCNAYGTSLGSSQIQCIQCQDKYYYDPLQQKCVQNPDTVSGCFKYEYNLGTLQCVQCSYEYVGLEGQTCFKISDKIPGCQTGEYKNSTNQYFQCDECEQGKSMEIKTKSSDECFQNPSNGQANYIENCQIYQKQDDQVKCKVCNINYALTNNLQCQLVQEQQKIDNCLQYKSSDSKILCEKCLDDYFVDSLSTCTYCEFVGYSNMLEFSLLVLMVQIILLF